MLRAHSCASAHHGGSWLTCPRRHHCVTRCAYLQTLLSARPTCVQVHVYFKRFDEAEQLYRKMDRLDLAINMRSRLGDWFKVEKLLKESGGNDVALVNAWNKIGEYYSDRQKWTKAAQFYTQVGKRGWLVVPPAALHNALLCALPPAQ